jgi:hypothetical protein
LHFSDKNFLKYLGFIGEIRKENGLKRLATVGNFNNPESVETVHGDYKLIDKIPKNEMRKIINNFKN